MPVIAASFVIQAAFFHDEFFNFTQKEE